MTIVVNIHDLRSGWERDPRYIYCGRAGHGFDGRYGNRHVIGWCEDCRIRHSRADAIAAHRVETETLYASDAAFRAEIDAMRGHFLVCFCAPQACHCDNYARLADHGVQRICCVRYLGGKSKIAQRIAAVILSSVSERETLIDTCFGGGSVFEVLAPHFAHPCAGDVHPDLMMMWQAVAQGWVPPSVVTEEQYRWLKDQPPSALRGFVGFCCSFSAIWFSTYARPSASEAGRNIADEASRSVVRMRTILERAELRQCSYDAWDVRAGNVVYCDKPYEGTQEYAGTPPFDHACFWRVADLWVEAGAHVFVSEYTAPSHWKCLAEATHKQHVAGGQNHTVTTERLFTRSRGRVFARTGIVA